jgi:hypothetical protein
MKLFLFKHFSLHLFYKPIKKRKMNEPNMNQEDVSVEQQNTSPEEYLKARDAAIQHLTKEMVFLKVEKEYEALLADIEESKTRRITMIAQRARFYQKNEDRVENPTDARTEKPVENNAEPAVKRKLKQD